MISNAERLLILIVGHLKGVSSIRDTPFCWLKLFRLKGDCLGKINKVGLIS